jgi:hypothetical protein
VYITPETPTMTSAKKRESRGLSKELNEPIPDPGMFEDIPKIKKIAGPSNGP